MTDALVLGHLLGAFLFVGGSTVAAVLRAAAVRRERPAEVALLLRAVRPAVPLVAGGLVLAIGFGVWLVEEIGLDWGAAWISATLVLVVWMLVVGAVAGRQDRRTRELAERLAAAGAERSDELRARLRNPWNLASNASMLAATLAVIVLMVLKPA